MLLNCSRYFLTVTCTWQFFRFGNVQPELFSVVQKKGPKKPTLLTKDTPMQIWHKEKMEFMKKIIGKAKDSTKSNFPRKHKIDRKLKTGEDEIANEFNKYFADIGPSLAKNIRNPLISFDSFLKRVNTTLPSQSLSKKELKDNFLFSLKTNKSPGADEINFNVIKHCFGELCGPYKYLFDSSLQNGVFPGIMIIAIVLPVFKTGITADVSNYPPVSVFPYFSKILERVMYNHLYKYLTDRKILHPQQFGFRKKSTL